MELRWRALPAGSAIIIIILFLIIIIIITIIIIIIIIITVFASKICSAGAKIFVRFVKCLTSSYAPC